MQDPDFISLAGTAPVNQPKPTPAQKLRIASALYATAKKVKLAALRNRHPDWPEQRVIEETNRRLFLLRD